MNPKKENMGSDIIAEIKRGRGVGYSDRLIRKSLEMEGYSDGAIKQAFKEIDKPVSKTNLVIKTQSIKQKKDDMPAAPAGREEPRKHWIKIVREIVIGIGVFSAIGIMLYLFFLPAVLA